MMPPPQRQGVGSAHSKLILIGEHAVVYGQPAIALPFPLLNVTSTVENGNNGIYLTSEFFTGPISNLPNQLKGIGMCIFETLDKLQAPTKELHIRLVSNIPIGRGLGSSAAIAVAIVRSLFSYFEQKLSRQTLMSLVHVAETYAHGNPSGIDMACVSSTKPIWFEKGEEVVPIHLAQPLHLLVADTGRVGDTWSAVTAVRKSYLSKNTGTKASIERLGALTIKARENLAGDQSMELGRLLNAAHEELVNIGVSDEGLDQLVKAAQQAGALGAKLTGGGRGGCILALAHNQNHAEELSQALLDVGAQQTWACTLSSE
ncbi:mevalonate kinase [Salinibacillus xinjiangensis]|uniref:mevalonate kinase n=1 Tax=Salinibacillus xinjiangensis TaxID=1229268 RepID=A0A6G1X434_9BACI|nr:mevalonate kinase [Salinibacillus xinjiangensis]MRG85707.1 mevalonate kinase [Salinibacillus xinjiangensis]